MHFDITGLTAVSSISFCPLHFSLSLRHPARCFTPGLTRFRVLGKASEFAHLRSRILLSIYTPIPLR
jgi:hypothetical protein